MTKYLMIGVLASSLWATIAHAESDCEKQASDKNLSGMDKTTFIANCEKKSASSAASDAAKQCAKEAKDKGLSGTAKTDFVKHCAKSSEKK